MNAQQGKSNFIAVGLKFHPNHMVSECLSLCQDGQVFVMHYLPYYHKDDPMPSETTWSRLAPGVPCSAAEAKEHLRQTGWRVGGQQ